jgi:hypothetical protein
MSSMLVEPGNRIEREIERQEQGNTVPVGVAVRLRSVIRPLCLRTMPSETHRPSPVPVAG